MTVFNGYTQRDELHSPRNLVPNSSPLALLHLFVPLAKMKVNLYN